jgi:hypothetical protein
MKNKMLVLVVVGLIALGISCTANGTSVQVNLNTDNWGIYNSGWYPYYEYSPRVGPTYQNTLDGLQVNGSGYRAGTTVFFKETGKFEDATIYFKWMANGGDGFYWGMPTNPSYMGVGFGLGWLEGDEAMIEGVIAEEGGMTTNHSYAGSYRISDDTWYYTTINIEPDQHFSVNTASNDYAEDGGSIFHGYSGTIDDETWAHINAATLFAGFGDNYGGANARITLGEVRYDMAEMPSSIPEPATLVLFTSGIIVACAVLRIKG